MATNKLELFMGCFGNGITVCNKAVMEYGDYKKIAHIEQNGKIKCILLISDDYQTKVTVNRKDLIGSLERGSLLLYLYVILPVNIKE